MNRGWFLERLRQWGDREAVVGEDWSARYSDLLSLTDRWIGELAASGVGPGRVVAFEGDCRDSTVALLLALLEKGCVAVPLTSAAGGQRPEFLEIAQVEFLIGDPGAGSTCQAGEAIVCRGDRQGHPLLETLAQSGRPGLVLFSSGSTGRPKAMIHDLDKFLDRYVKPRPPKRILSFLLLDHIGGINTLLAGLAQGGTIVTIRERQPESICRTIAKHQVQVLPTSPTFLNLLLLSEEHRRHDLSSLELITYGTEPMPASTLERLRRVFPRVRFLQTYGLSELGILKSRSREDGSLWVQVGGEGYQTRIVDGVLWIKAETAMLGYLNAPSPFDAEGWFNTQDAVEQDSDWIRILGRTTDLINVGGQKVYPAEIESVLLEMDNVLDVTVHGEPNPLVGQCVVARVNLLRSEAATDFKARMRRHCQRRLAPYMIPVKVEIVDAEQFNVRCKRMRNQGITTGHSYESANDELTPV